MDNCKDFNNTRAALLRLLGKLYLIEVDKETLTALKAMRFPEISGNTSAEMDLAEGYALVNKYFSTCEENDEAVLEDLAVDYAVTFLSAGDQSGKAAFPYESVYVNRQNQICGENQTLIEQLFGEKGLKLREDMFRVYADHIGTELEYLAGLIEEGNDREAKLFLKKHLLSWSGSFTSDTVKYASTDFYKGWAKITNGLLGLEKEYYGL